MLTYLSVKNIAVIEQVSLEFGDGLNVITGETGAGKSVLVGALKYLTGDRSGKVSSRDSSLKYSAEAIFCNVEHLDSEISEQYNIEDEIIILRETDENGKNKTFLNNKPITVNGLRDITETLIDIHGQHENQFLFNPSKHLSFVDNFVDEKIREDYVLSYREYKSKYDELENIKKNIDDIKQKYEIYSYQYNEINDMNINIAADSVIEDRIKLLSNMEKVKEAVQYCVSSLTEGEVTAHDLISTSISRLGGIRSFSREAEEAEELLNTALSNIVDAESIIKGLVSESEEYGQSDLNDLIDRKFKLIELMKKYGGSLEEVLAYKDKLEDNMNKSSFDSESIRKYEEEVERLKRVAEQKAGILNKKRMEASKEISSRIEEILKELELPSSKFEVVFKESDSLDINGGVSAEFFISTNAGFKPSPLAMSASGGEVSRVMLALKEVFADYDNIDTMLFDEIDTGISGKAAKSVALKLKNLSRKKQIIVITHLPVVAAMGDNHFHITKNIQDGVSSTKITKLDNKSKINMIATMIAGEVTEAAVQQAEDLIKRGQVGRD